MVLNKQGGSEMKPKTMPILLCGPHRKMLEARQRILQLLGHQVWIATDLAEIERVVTTVDRLDLLVLSHSFSRQECGRAITLAHARWPGMRICILPAGIGSLADGISKEVSAACTKPLKLWSGLERLVAQESSAYSHLY